MNKMKKIIAAVIVMLIGIVGFLSTSKVYASSDVSTIIPQVVKSPNVSNEYYKLTENLFCVEKGQQLAVNLGTNNYDAVGYYIDIEGNKATLNALYWVVDGYWDFDEDGVSIHEYTSKNNAILGYILSAYNNTDSKGFEPDGGTKDEGAVANAIWGFFNTWLVEAKDKLTMYDSSTHQTIPGSQRFKAGFAESGDEFEAAIGYPNEYGEQLIAEARNYANSLSSSGSEITDNSTGVGVTKIDNNYVKIGPFNWTFPGSMSSITANVSLYGFYDSYGNAISASGVKSGKDFYVKVKKDDVKDGINLKLSGKAKVNKKRVRIYFLVAQGETTNTKYQNLIYREKLTEGSQVDLTGTFTYTTPQLKGNLKIVKVNKNNTNVKLDGVGFLVKNNDTGKYVRRYSDGSIAYVDKSSATEFIADSNGEINISNLLIGTYTAYETKNPKHYGYKLDTSGTTIEVNIGGTTTKQIPNEQVYIKLSGKVWIDKISEKQSVRNNLYKSNSNDSADTTLNGITVRLKEKSTGNTIKTATTASGGTYLFSDVLISKLSNYYIEFEYDGLTYTNVVPYINNSSGSKAAESSTKRDEFNKKFSWVDGGKNTSGTQGSNLGLTRYENGNSVHDLSYKISSHKATLINNGQYKIVANTSIAGYSIKNHFTYGQEEIKNINLGLYEREQPDIALVQDIENVKVSINGQWHTYNYASRFLNMDTTKENKFNVGVKFGEKYGNQTYSRAIYQSDYNYTDSNNPDKELKVYVTYKITIRNESTTLTTVVHGIEDYFDSNYELYSVGSKLEANGNISTTNNNVRFETPSSYNSNYMKTRIWQDNTISIPSQSEKDIYVQFKLNRQAILKIINNKENLENVSEIKHYSVYDKSGNRYAGIDTDSNPNNCTPGNKNTYEDDTDSAPGLKLVLQDERTTSGKVFLDSTTGELQSGSVRQGSGKYENSEKGIRNVEVTLLNKDNSVAKMYDQASKTWIDAKTITDKNGDYTIGGYIPGEYKIVYTWGDKTYKVQNYKGTVYETWDRATDDQWYKYKPEARYSDAMDDYDTRINIDEQTKIMTNANKQAIQKYDNATIEKEDGSEETLITRMNATTPVYKVNVEYSTAATDSINEYELDKNGNIKMNGDYVVKKDGYKNQIKNIDFGIVERARQILELNKRIKEATVTLTNSTVLIDAEINKDGTIKNSVKYATYMPESPGAGALLKLEIDQEIIEGANLDIIYDFEIVNKSEIDYTDKNFYLYGEVPTNKQSLVTLTPNAIIDYLDSMLSISDENSNTWETLQNADDIKELVDKGLLSQSVKDSLDVTSRVLNTEDISGSLKPIGTDSEIMTTIELKCHKLLSENDDNILENYAEIIKVTKSGGASLVTTPGNYIPADSSTSEQDNSNSSGITIIGPTGLETDIIGYTLLAISSLGILVVGIVLIKKYIMK